MTGKLTTFARHHRAEMTSAEKRLWHVLRAHRFHDLHFRRQVPFEHYIADFACLSQKLIIEVDGATHATEQEIQHDLRRQSWFEQAGFRVLRFYNAEIFENLDGVLETILFAIRSEPAPPP